MGLLLYVCDEVYRPNYTQIPQKGIHYLSL
jgi:hypothetical protein